MAANAYELNNLDNEALDAPMYVSGAPGNQLPTERTAADFASLPCETFLVACRTEQDLVHSSDSFRHKNPIYQSAHVQLTSETAPMDDANGEVQRGGEYKYLFIKNKRCRYFFFLINYYINCSSMLC